ncbi:MAG TPA: hypothetical protein ENG87_02440 [Candidatus Pacearchaeota archaeon]|nr:hypothetical protein BMS3Abin17_00489 [archaeon BMS3Abin17]HDK42214.1 hypothetical protein [Candidatus Pacearchaeota archaeon]HDZ61072.1 hypothetical protein [Candidatus Pacearchaeota archaeon]
MKSLFTKLFLISTLIFSSNALAEEPKIKKENYLFPFFVKVNERVIDHEINSWNNGIDIENRLLESGYGAHPKTGIDGKEAEDILKEAGENTLKLLVRKHKKLAKIEEQIHNLIDLKIYYIETKNNGGYINWKKHEPFEFSTGLKFSANPLNSKAYIGIKNFTFLTDFNELRLEKYANGNAHLKLNKHLGWGMGAEAGMETDDFTKGVGKISFGLTKKFNDNLTIGLTGKYNKEGKKIMAKIEFPFKN